VERLQVFGSLIGVSKIFFSFPHFGVKQGSNSLFLYSILDYDCEGDVYGMIRFQIIVCFFI